MSSTLLDARQVTRRHGTRTVLDSVDVRVDAGTRIGLIGRNGAGKSTLMRVLAGLERPDGGEVRRFPLGVPVTKAVKAGPKGRGGDTVKDGWPAWHIDQRLAAAYTDQIRAAFADVFTAHTARRIASRWLNEPAHGQPDGAGDGPAVAGHDVAAALPLRVSAANDPNLLSSLPVHPMEEAALPAQRPPLRVAVGLECRACQGLRLSRPARGLRDNAVLLH